MKYELQFNLTNELLLHWHLQSWLGAEVVEQMYTRQHFQRLRTIAFHSNFS